MYIELGTGKRSIIYYNSDKLREIDAMLMRIVTAYKAMLDAGYPSIITADRNCRLIFTSESPVCTGLRIDISSRPCGIYTDKSAYHKQIARAFFTMIGFNIYEWDCTTAVEIGVGGIDAKTQGYVLLKDAIFGLVNIV